ncbi:hypothetical protein SM124_02260 [Bacillus sp. 31A1R]|uniref:Abortive phage infection protein n=1 Tax=Robertmurraya mangrovi TaxID=3098077 RepID=A0ABU5ITU7_9BACI|nr:hypothetical protein [Bacillus sp. 31A1R]MDZ5470564.1 hypothetical protein [Bacillus sp. 31A1R]
MNEQLINESLDQLRRGEISELFVKKEDFLSFRKVIVKREDFKQFRGIAQHGGNVVYQYLDVPRS